MAVPSRNAARAVMRAAGVPGRVVLMRGRIATWWAGSLSERSAEWAICAPAITNG
jgi:hypothetical protein